MFNKIKDKEKGQGLVEYALILVLVGTVVIAILLLLGPAIRNTFCEVTNEINRKVACGIDAQAQRPNPHAAAVKIFVNVTEPMNVSVTVTSPPGVSVSPSSASCVVGTPCQFNLTTQYTGSATVSGGGYSTTVSWPVEN